MEAYILMEKLQEFIEQHGEESEVRIAEQPSWPFEYDIKGCVDSVEMGQEDEDAAPVFYIVEGTQLGYFRKDAWDACS